MGVVWAVSIPVTLGIVALAIRLSGVSIKEYLGLKWPSWRQFLVGFTIVAAIVVIGDCFIPPEAYEADSYFAVESYTTARDTGPIVFILFALGLVLTGPLEEEVLFRGFFYRGASAGLGNAGAIVLLSLIWAATHVQYETYYIAQIFILGLALGWLRWWSGSLLLPLALHVLMNAASLATTAIDPSV